MRYLLLALATSVSSALLAAGCSCTEIGCDSYPRVVVSDLVSTHQADLPFSVHACIDDTQCGDVTVVDGATCTDAKDIACNMVQGDSSLSFQLMHALSDEDSHVISVTVKGKDGATIWSGQKSVTAIEDQPNGAMCDPTCYQATASFTP